MNSERRSCVDTRRGESGAHKREIENRMRMITNTKYTWYFWNLKAFYLFLKTEDGSAARDISHLFTSASATRAPRCPCLCSMRRKTPRSQPGPAAVPCPRRPPLRHPVPPFSFSSMHFRAVSRLYLASHPGPSPLMFGRPVIVVGTRGGREKCARCQ